MVPIVFARTNDDIGPTTPRRWSNRGLQERAFCLLSAMFRALVMPPPPWRRLACPCARRQSSNTPKQRGGRVVTEKACVSGGLLVVVTVGGTSVPAVKYVCASITLSPATSRRPSSALSASHGMCPTGTSQARPWCSVPVVIEHSLRGGGEDLCVRAVRTSPAVLPSPPSRRTVPPCGFGSSARWKNSWSSPNSTNRVGHERHDRTHPASLHRRTGSLQRMTWTSR